MPLHVYAGLDVELNEGAGFGHFLPGRAFFAGAQAHNGIADSQRLPGLHRQFAGSAVALVEQADDRHAVGHGRARQAGNPEIGFFFLIDRLGLVDAVVQLGATRTALASGEAGQKAEQNKSAAQPAARCGTPGPAHASGVQAS